MFLKISQISRENSCVGVFFKKKGLQHRRFPVKFVKFIGTPILKSICVAIEILQERYGKKQVIINPHNAKEMQV